MDLLVLGPDQVRALLPMDACIEAVDGALRALQRDRSVNPLRPVLWLPDRRGALGLMPAFEGASGLLGTKVVTVFPGNHGTELDAHQGMVLVFEGERGRPVALLDGSEITAIRTAAASGVATRALAREDAAVLTILGAGIQARQHARAMAAVRDLQEVRIWNRTHARAQQLAEWVTDSLGVPARALPDPAGAVRDADIVCTTTSSPAPILEGAWLADGVHVNAVGSSVKFTRELDGAAVAACRMFVDRRESTVNESGDFLLAVEDGSVPADHPMVELGAVLEGASPGRTAPGERTLYESLGLGIEDVAAAALVVQRAREQGVGHRIPWGGARDAH